MREGREAREDGVRRVGARGAAHLSTTIAMDSRTHAANLAPSLTARFSRNFLRWQPSS